MIKFKWIKVVDILGCYCNGLNISEIETDPFGENEYFVKDYFPSTTRINPTALMHVKTNDLEIVKKQTEERFLKFIKTVTTENNEEDNRVFK